MLEPRAFSKWQSVRGAVPGPSEDAVMTISLHEMKAWWAFTEMKSQRTRSFYHDSRVPMMQRKLQGLDFANVAMPDRDVLVEMWETGTRKISLDVSSRCKRLYSRELVCNAVE